MLNSNGRADDRATGRALLRIGQVGGAHGLAGALRVKLDNPDSETLQTANRLFFDHAGETHEYRVHSAARVNRNIVKLAVEGLNTPEAAEALRGAVVMVDEADLPPAAPGEFYYHQAIGCEVVTLTGERIGVIEEIFSTGANDVWVVRHGAREVLVPVIENVVKVMDLEHRRMTIEAVPGLIEP